MGVERIVLMAIHFYRWLNTPTVTSNSVLGVIARRAPSILTSRLISPGEAAMRVVCGLFVFSAFMTTQMDISPRHVRLSSQVASDR